MPTLADLLDPEKKDELLKRLQLQFMLSNFKNDYARGKVGNARIGYQQPIVDGDITAGISGSGYDVSSNGERYREFKPSDFDLSYSRGPNTFGANYRFGTGEMTPSMFLRYIRKF